MTAIFDGVVWLDDRLSRITAFGGSKGGSAPAGNTTTTVQPWPAQQPFLLEGFNRAQDLLNNYTPQYFPNSTAVGPNATQWQGLNMLENSALAAPQQFAPASQFVANVGAGNFLNSDPSRDMLYQFGQHNIGENNAGTNTLTTQANAGIYNPAYGTLNDYASGSHTAADNPYTSALTQNVLSQVLPSIQQQFIEGGSMASPQAAFASAQGATNALGPLLFQRQQQEEQNQLGAASTLGSQALQGAGLQQSAASILGNEALQGRGLQTQGANDLASATNDAYRTALFGASLAPTMAGIPYTAAQQMYGAGATQQQQEQNLLNAEIGRWNYNQTLPYNQLNQFMGTVSGNMGSSTTQPFFQNGLANALGLGLGGITAANSLIPGGIGGLFGGGAGAAAELGGDFGGGGAALGVADQLGGALPAAAAWIVCTELVKQGRMPKRWWVSGARVFAAYPDIAKRGYYVWAIPSVRHLRRRPGSLYSRLLCRIFNWRAEDIAARAGVKGARKLWRGRMITAALALPCLALGAISSDRDWREVYRLEKA